jgi:hypothetical protein
MGILADPITCDFANDLAVRLHLWQTWTARETQHDLSDITMDARVQDYLDDKLQSAADLDSLSSLLDNVREQQQLLKQQVSNDA